MNRPFRFSPAPVAHSVLRPRLLGVLARRFELRLVTIEAGAGLGKTTLLGHAVSENRLAPKGRDCWLTCEPADSSASTLLGALLEACGAPEAGDVPRVEQVCEAVWASTPEHLCLVLDDVHAIEQGSSGEQVLRRLLEELPENGHLVLAGRRLPELPRSRLVVHNRVAEVSADDLRLDDDETAAFAAAHAVSRDVVRDAGGWPALAELYARAGRTHAEDFVWEEVLRGLPPPDLDAFLLLVAVGGADGELLDATVGSSFDAGRIASLPLVQTDARGGLYPHAIWEELLRARIDASAAAEARRRLAAALLSRGDNGHAFELLAATRDWEGALPALFEACNDQRLPPWPDQMERWRRLIPDSEADAPEVRYLEAMRERARDPWSTNASELFAQAYEGFQARGDVVREASARVRAIYLAWCRGDRTTFDDMYTRARELIAVGVPVESIAVFNRAAAADIEGDTDTIRELVPQIGPLEPRLRHFRGLLLVFAALADGDADAAVAEARDAAASAIPVAPAAGTGWAALAPNAVAWARADIHGVLVEPPRDPGARYPLAERIPAMAIGAVVAAHVGDLEQARALLADVDALVPELGDRDLLAGFRGIAAAAVATGAGDERAAADALAAALDARALAPAGAARAVHWLPSLPYLFHPPSRVALDALPTGPSRRRTLDVCRALLDARANGAAVPSPVLDDPVALLADLPAALATELVVRAAGERPAALHVGCIAALVDVVPKAVRNGLRTLTENADPSIASAANALLATVPIPPDEHVRIEVFGPARLLRDGVAVEDPDWRRQRVREVMCALVALREVRRARLGAMLWPDFDAKAVSANLRMTLSYVQGLLEPHRDRGNAPWFLQQSAGVLQLRADDHLSVDAWEFDDALDAAAKAAASASPSIELHHLLTAVTLWRGEYLEDVAGAEWADPLREWSRQRFLQAAVRAGGLLVASGRASEAVRIAERALAVDPWYEPAMRLQMSAHLAAGDRAAARSAHDAAIRTLADLGVRPEPATEDLGRQITGSR